MAEKVIVTGGSGRAGEYIISELAANGYEVYNADAVAPVSYTHLTLPTNREV